MDTPTELELSQLDANEYQGEISDAIDNARDQGKITWLLGRDRKRIAAIVPVDVAEYLIGRVLHTPAGRHAAT